jgi:hypothetical protein
MSDEPARPDLDTLADYLEGLLGAQESREVERWVAEDAATADLLHELERVPGLLAADPVGPMPRDVVDRVDAALAEASQAGSPRPAAAPRSPEEGAGAVVVPLRRRWLAPTLAAAAMLGVVAIGAQVVSSVDTSGQDGAGDAGSAADAPADVERDAGAQEDAAPGAEAPTYSASMLPPIRTEAFATDVADALGNRPSDWVAAERAVTDAGVRLRDSVLTDECPVELGAGRVLPIRLDGDLAVLLLRRIPGEPDRREALAYPARCGDLSAEATPQPLARAVIVLP